MAKVAVEQVFNNTIPDVVLPGGTYDPAKVGLGLHMDQQTLDGQSFVGPRAPATASFGEAAISITTSFVHPVKVADDLWWIFTGGENTTAAATRRVGLWTWIPSTNTLTFVGGVTLTFPTATSHTVRGLRVVLRKITTGTVAVSGTAVTGTGTSFVTTDAVSVGSRIRFAGGAWFEVGAVGSDTGITLTASAGVIGAGTAYEIEDLIIVVVTTNATTTNGGLFVAKGLRFELFTQPVTAIPAAVSTDRVRAVYWLKDAAVVTNITGGGCAIEDPVSGVSQFVYVCDGAATTLRMFKYNVRAVLTVASGAATLAGADIVITGTQAVTGNISQVNNGRVATLLHGPGSGVPCVYLMTTTRILRIPTAGITAASTTFVADNMAEVPPGGTATNAAVVTFSSFDIASSLDRIFIAGPASLGTHYVTQYRTDGGQFERRFGMLSNQLASTLSDTDLPEFPHNIGANAQTIWVEDGFVFMVNTTNGANVNQMFIFPAAADWVYGQKVIAPKITVAASKLYRVVVNSVENIGDDTMGVGPDAFRVLFRTSGIDDNSGAWTVVAPNGDLSGIGAVTSIQFAFEFRTLGTVLIPARILSLALIYESSTDLPAQYQWNFGDVDLSNGTFAWIQRSLFGGTPGTHTIEIYRADTNALVLTQASTGSTNGVFENHSGLTWVSGLGDDTVGRRRRFVPTGSLPAGVDLYAKITVA